MFPSVSVGESVLCPPPPHHRIQHSFLSSVFVLRSSGRFAACARFPKPLLRQGHHEGILKVARMDFMAAAWSVEGRGSFKHRCLVEKSLHKNGRKETPPLEILGHSLTLCAWPQWGSSGAPGCQLSLVLSPGSKASFLPTHLSSALRELL